MNYKDFKESIKSFIRMIPIFSGLPDVRKVDHWEALKEFTANLIGSTMPLWVGTFVVLVLSKGVIGSYCEAFRGNINNGELFIYATSTLAPIYYMSLVDPPRARQFPTKLSHIITVSIIMVLSAVAFGLERAGQKLNNEFAYHSSIIFFILSLLLVYLATVYKNARFDLTEEELQEPERKFSKSFQDHR